MGRERERMVRRNEECVGWCGEIYARQSVRVLYWRRERKRERETNGSWWRKNTGDSESLHKPPPAMGNTSGAPRNGMTKEDDCSAKGTRTQGRNTKEREGERTGAW